MRSRRVRSRAVLSVTVLALLASGCSAFNPKSDVQMRGVGIDLAFGAKVDPTIVASDNPLPVVPIAPIELPPVVRPTLPPVVEQELCPPPSAISPKYPAPSRVKDGEFEPDNAEQGGNLPPEDKFLFFFAGNRAEEEYKEDFGYKAIDAVGADGYPGGYDGIHYRVKNPFSGINLWFSVVPSTEQIDAVNGTDDGLFLRRLEIPVKGAEPGDDPLVFAPATAETSGGLRLLHFPIQEGKSFDDQSEDIATKQNQVGGVFTTSANTLTSTSTVGPKEIFPVCDQLAQAWKITLEIQSYGEYRWSMIGTFWLGTHIGGWPLKEDFIFFSHDDKLISGNFYDNMARLDPGDYI
jgi:hypothetical protein